MSASHALITQKEGAWWLRDLGSRNGTLLNGDVVPPGAAVSIPEGATLSFGGEEALFDWLSDGPPGPVAVRGSDRAVVGCDEGMLLLPGPDAPEVVVYADDDVGWVLEHDAGNETCVDGRIVSVGGEDWSIYVPAVLEVGELASTWDLSASANIDSIGLTLVVSQDEEHVDVRVRVHGSEQSLTPRVHHYLLLQLSRARVADIKAGVLDAEQGWVYSEELCKQLQIRPAALSLHMLRARQQLTNAGVEGAHPEHTLQKVCPR